MPGVGLGLFFRIHRYVEPFDRLPHTLSKELLSCRWHQTAPALPARFRVAASFAACIVNSLVVSYLSEIGHMLKLVRLGLEIPDHVSVVYVHLHIDEVQPETPILGTTGVEIE